MRYIAYVLIKELWRPTQEGEHVTRRPIPLNTVLMARDTDSLVFKAMERQLGRRESN
jgi:hypothetical protein